MVEVAVARAAREDQVVETDLVPFADDNLSREVDARDMPEMDLDVSACLNWTRIGTAISDGLRPAVAT